MTARWRNVALVLTAAVAGIAIAAAITWGTSQLVRQRIGLTSEPLTAGRRLLPAPAPRAAAPARTGRSAGPSAGPATPASPAPPASETSAGAPPRASGGEGEGDSAHRDD